MSWIDNLEFIYSFILFIPLDTASLVPPSAPCKAFGKVSYWHDDYFILSKLNYSVDDDALRWSGWWWWWWPNTINFSVSEQIYQVGSTASTSCKLCKRASSLKTHIVDKLLVHEIWDSKFRQNLKNIYCEHLVKWPKKQREMQISKNWSHFDQMLWLSAKPVNWTRRFWMLILPQDSPATQFMKTSYLFKVTFFKVHLDYSIK